MHISDDVQLFAQMLGELGLKRNISRAIAYLRDGKEATSRDLEIGADLRQPEVSITMRELLELDWVEVRQDKKPGKGRPYNIYKLKKPVSAIIEELEQKKLQESKEILESIQRLKELAGKDE
ncbi:MAG: transcriptional regulator [Methermicoccaceae archaeon]